MSAFKTAGECAQEYEARLIARHTADLQDALRECRAELADTQASATGYRKAAEEWHARCKSAECQRDTARAEKQALIDRLTPLMHAANAQAIANEAAHAALQSKVARAVEDLTELVGHALPTDSQSHAKDLALRALEVLR